MQELSFDPKATQEVELSLAADLTGAWLTSHGGIIDALQDFHVMGQDFLDKWVHYTAFQDWQSLKIATIHGSLLLLSIRRAT